MGSGNDTTFFVDHAALYAVLLMCAFLSPRAKSQEFVTIFEVSKAVSILYRL